MSRVIPSRLFRPLFALALASSCVAASAFEPGPLRAGAASIDVTPPAEWLPIAVNGGFAARFLDRVTDPLAAKAVVLSDGETTLALCVVDSCLIERELLDAAKRQASEKTGIPADRMMISTTHTHSAPAATTAHGTDFDPRYRDWIVPRIAEAIVAAHGRLAPAKAGWAVADCPEWVHCRRWIMKPGTAQTVPFTGHSDDVAQMNPGHGNPNKVRQTGPVDPAVTLLSLRTSDDKPLAVFANYSTHYAGAPGISADYFAVFAEAVRQHVGGGPEFVGILSNGTSGDANCVDFTQPTAKKFTHQTVGKEVAATTFPALDAIAYSDRVPLKMAQTTLTLGRRRPTPEETKQAQAFLDREVGDRLPRNPPESYARDAAFLATQPPTREIELQAIRIGGLGIATIPCETFGSTGLAIKAASPFQPTAVVGLANGYDGYLPPPDQHALGGYTTWRARWSCLEVDAEPKIVAALSGLLKQVADAE